MRQAFDEALRDRIGDGNEDDGNGVGCPAGGEQRGRGVGEDDVDAELDQLFGLRLRTGGIASRPAKLRLDVVRRRPTQLLKALLKRRRPFLSFRIAGGVAHQHADALHLRRLLRASCERPRCRAAERSYEFPSSDVPAILAAAPDIAPGR